MAKKIHVKENFSAWSLIRNFNNCFLKKVLCCEPQIEPGPLSPTPSWFHFYRQSEKTKIFVVPGKVLLDCLGAEFKNENPEGLVSQQRRRRRRQRQ